jgi:hypothetical protein
MHSNMKQKKKHKERKKASKLYLRPFCCSNGITSADVSGKGKFSEDKLA